MKKEEMKSIKWTFKNTKSPKKIELTSGKRVMVNYFYNNKKRNKSGKLHAINDSVLILKIHTGEEFQLPKNTITKIARSNGLGIGGKILGWTLAGTSFSFALIVLMLSQLLSGRPSLSSPGVGCSGGCLGPIVVAALLAIIFIVISIPTNIEAPFSNKWIVEQTSDAPHPYPQHQSP